MAKKTKRTSASSKATTAVAVALVCAVLFVGTADAFKLPNLMPGTSWTEQAQTCKGVYAARRPVGGYTGVPPPNWQPFQLQWSRTREEWNVTFGATTQYANATGAWTNPRGSWLGIAGINYWKQASFQNNSLDVSTDECLVRFTGLHRDITSCQCMLSSTITFFNITSLGCKLSFLVNHPGHLSTQQVLTKSGLVFLSWDFDQLYSVIISAGAFVATECVIGEPEIYAPIPAGNYADHCASFAPPSCNPPAGF